MSNCLTVKQLIAELQKMPQDLPVGFPNMEIDQTEPVIRVSIKNSRGGKEVILE